MGHKKPFKKHIMSTLTNNYGIESNTLLGQILDVLQPKINERIEAIRKAHLDQELSYSKFSEECDRYGLVLDMAKSIGSYTLPTDKLIHLESYMSAKGNYEISARLLRDGQEHILSTEVIYAGGYNIQRLHYRYITRTNLPKRESEVVKVIKAQISKIKKIQTIEDDIKRKENYITRREAEFSEMDALNTIEEKAGYYTKDWKNSIFTTWETLNDGAKEHYKTEENYNAHKQADFTEYALNVDARKSSAFHSIKASKKDIIKLEAKLKELKK